jgi:hypothetical protein
MRSMSRCFFVLVLGAWAIGAHASTSLVRDCRLDATFFPAEGRMVGHALITFGGVQPAGSGPTFYLHGELRVDSVRAGPDRATFEQARIFYDYDYSLVANRVTLSAFPRPTGAIEVWYSGYFHPSKARSPSDYMRVDSGGVFLRAYGYSLWFPVFLEAGSDDVVLDFSTVTIRTPAAYTSVFVGTRTGERLEGGDRIATWTAPATSVFAAQCTAQPYAVLSDGRYFLYHYPDSSSLGMARAIMTLATDLNREFGSRYRKSRAGGQYHLMEMPRYGDISSDNVTGITYWIWQKFTDDENSQRALAHELVHPYADVPVARSDSMFSFVVEGFPSYLHLPVLARRLGDDFYNRFLGWMETLYVEKRAKGVDRRGNAVPPEKPLLAIPAEELSTYKDEFVLSDRALLLLNWLYARMGEERFFRFTSELLNLPTLTTQRFRDMVEEHLPGSRQDLSIWLATTEYPARLHFDKFRRNLDASSPTKAERRPR